MNRVTWSDVRSAKQGSYILVERGDTYCQLVDISNNGHVYYPNRLDEDPRYISNIDGLVTSAKISDICSMIADGSRNE